MEPHLYNAICQIVLNQKCDNMMGFATEETSMWQRLLDLLSVHRNGRLVWKNLKILRMDQLETGIHSIY